MNLETDRKRRMTKYAVLFQDVVPSEILPHLTCLPRSQKERIKQREFNDGASAAAYEFSLIICKYDNWFDQLIPALREEGRTKLAALLDDPKDDSLQSNRQELIGSSKGEAEASVSRNPHQPKNYSAAGTTQSAGGAYRSEPAQLPKLSSRAPEEDIKVVKKHPNKAASNPEEQRNTVAATAMNISEKSVVESSEQKTDIKLKNNSNDPQSNTKADKFTRDIGLANQNMMMSEKPAEGLKLSMTKHVPKSRTADNDLNRNRSETDQTLGYGANCTGKTLLNSNPQLFSSSNNPSDLESNFYQDEMSADDKIGSLRTNESMGGSISLLISESSGMSTAESFDTHVAVSRAATSSAAPPYINAAQTTTCASKPSVTSSSSTKLGNQAPALSTAQPTPTPTVPPTQTTEIAHHDQPEASAALPGETSAKNSDIIGTTKSSQGNPICQPNKTDASPSFLPDACLLPSVNATFTEETLMATMKKHGVSDGTQQIKSDPSISTQNPEGISQSDQLDTQPRASNLSMITRQSVGGIQSQSSPLEASGGTRAEQTSPSVNTQQSLVGTQSNSCDTQSQSSSLEASGGTQAVQTSPSVNTQQSIEGCHDDDDDDDAKDKVEHHGNDEENDEGSWIGAAMAHAPYAFSLIAAVWRGGDI